MTVKNKKSQMIKASLLVASFLILNTITSVLGAGDVEKAYCHANSGSSGYQYKYNKAWDTHFENNGTPSAGHELDFYTVVGDENCDGISDIPVTPPSLTPTLPVTSPVATITPTTLPTLTLTPTPSPFPTVTPSPVPTLTVTPSPEPTLTITPTPGENITDPTITMTPTPEPEATVTSTPSEVLSSSSQYDACTNVEGIQSSVPDGWFQNGADSTECRQFQYGGAPENNGVQGQVLGASTSRGQVLGASTLAFTGEAENFFFMLGLILTGVSVYGLTLKNAKENK